VRRIAGECTYVDERDAVGIRLEPAAAIDENQDGTRGSNLLCSSGESCANLTSWMRRTATPLIRPDEILVVMAIADGGRLRNRCGTEPIR